MKKGSYVVQEVYESSGSGVKGGGGGGGGAASSAPHAYPDSSYSSCLLALLFFLALCIIIMLAAWPWNKGKAAPPLQEENDHPVHEGFSGDEGSTLPPHGETPEKHSTKAPSTKAPPPPPHVTEPYYHPETTEAHRVTTYRTPQETDEEEGEGHEDGGHHPHPEKGHHHPHPEKGHHHPHPEEGHHHEHEFPVTTTARWDPVKDTPLPHANHSKGGNVKDDKRRPSKGLRPRIGDGEEDPSAEWVGETHPDEHTEEPGGGKHLRIVDASRNDEASTTEASPKTTTTGAPTSSRTEKHTVPVAGDGTAEDGVTKPADEESAIVGLPEGEGSTTAKVETTTGPSVANANETEGDMMGSLSHNLDDLNEEDKDKGVEEKNLEVCQTPSCKSLAARILALMDHSANPCDNFYEYACGGMTAASSNWISEEVPGSNAWSRVSDMLSRVNQLSPIGHQKFKSFHDSCIFYGQHVNFEYRLQKAHDVLASIGKFYRDTEWKESPGNLTVLIGNLLKHHFSPLFDILLDVDSKSSKFSIKLIAPVNKSPFGDSDGVALNGWESETCKQSAIEKPKNKMNVDFKERHEEYIKCSHQYEEYIQQVKSAIEALKIIKYENETITQNLITDTTLYLDVLFAETVVNNFPTQGEKRRILLAKEFNMYSLREMKEKFPLIEWKHLISMLLGQEIGEETEIQVYFENYFQSLFHNLSTSGIDDRRVNNALMAMFAHELYHGLVVDRSPCNRKAYCLNVALQLMDPVASALFLQSFDTAQLSAFETKIMSIFKELLTTLKFEISKLEWMDGNSQNLALDKLHNLKLYADGGASVFLNESFLEAQFAKVAANKTYLENSIDLIKRYREKMYEIYQKDPFEPEQIWSHFLLPYREQGIVIYGLNSLVIPYGQMFKPFFSEDYPLYIQMSSLGFMIAHEIWHQFDTTGVQYDSRGHRDNKFSETTMAAINKTAKCVTEQADVKIEDTTSNGEKFSYRLNPSISLNERLVDMGGAHLAFKTSWKTVTSDSSVVTLPWTSLTPQQLYFLSLAQNFCTKSSAFDYAVSIFEDEHLPPFKRVNDIAFNSVEFTEAFSCTPEKTRCQPFTL